MPTEALRAGVEEVAQLHELFRHTAHCQVVADSMMRRGLADPFLLSVDGRAAGYAAVMNRYDPGRIRSFFVLPQARRFTTDLLRALVAANGATEFEAQSNIPTMLTVLYDHATEIVAESILFDDVETTALVCPGARLRATDGSEASAGRQSYPDSPAGDWALEIAGEDVATGGALTHYNPPYADIWMDVREGWRGKGYGSFLVQEVKRICYERGYKPAARCGPDNVASRRTLEKAGFRVCGRLLVGSVRGLGDAAASA